MAASYARSLESRRSSQCERGVSDGSGGGLTYRHARLVAEYLRMAFDVTLGADAVRPRDAPQAVQRTLLADDSLGLSDFKSRSAAQLPQPGIRPTTRMPAKIAADDSQNFQVSNDGFKSGPLLLTRHKAARPNHAPGVIRVTASQTRAAARVSASDERRLSLGGALKVVRTVFTLCVALLGTGHRCRKEAVIVTRGIQPGARDVAGIVDTLRNGSRCTGNIEQVVIPDSYVLV